MNVDVWSRLLAICLLLESALGPARAALGVATDGPVATGTPRGGQDTRPIRKKRVGFCPSPPETTSPDRVRLVRIGRLGAEYVAAIEVDGRCYSLAKGDELDRGVGMALIREVTATSVTIGRCTKSSDGRWVLRDDLLSVKQE